MKFFLCVIGMVMIVEGIPYFVSPDKMKQMIRMVTELPDHSLRWFGGILMAAGLVIVYASRNFM
ncbi:MAG: DUF2065 domain-containing protein [Desulfobacteraceae bacterium]